MVSRYHPGQQVLLSEYKGFVSDIVILLPLFILLGLFYLFLRRFSKPLAEFGPMVMAALYFVAAVLILQFFIYQLRPLDKFLFEHSRQEVRFTIRTTEVNYWQIGGFITGALLLAIFIYRIKDERSKMANLSFAGLILAGLPLFLVGGSGTEQDIYVLNKPVYFYQSAYRYFSEREQTPEANSRELVREYRQAFPGKNYLGEEYPFLHETTKDDVLGNWLKQGEEAPQLVVLMVEGLANDFLHPYHGLQLMPFLDSLKNQSLYWDRFLTLGERSYAVTPSLTASLPYGRSGFTMLESQPYHFSLVNVLKQNGYFTSFYYGQGAWFHNKNVYYEQNFIDRIIDKEKFEAKYPRIVVKEEKDFFWGYDDRSLFEQAMLATDTLNAPRRLDLFFTGSMHNPFTIQESEKYEKRLQKALEHHSEEKEFYSKYGKYLRATMFADEAIQKYFKWYSRRPDFKRTVFIITGDHPMTDIPINNSLKRYHVPLIIYSPMLKGPHQFHSVGSHLDVYEPLLVWLQKNYQLQIPQVQSSVSNVLDTTSAFINRKPVIFMNGNRDIVDLYSATYYLADDQQLYTVDENFNLTPSGNTAQMQKMQKQLELFRRANAYATFEQQLLPDSLYFSSLGYNPYAFTQMKLVNFTKGSCEVISQTLVPNQTLYLDLFGMAEKALSKPLHGVYQLTNSKDSVLLWVSFGIDAGKKTFRYHQKIELVHTTDTMLRFKCYLLSNEEPAFKLKAKAAVFAAKH